MADALATLIKRGSYGRSLYAGCIRGLAEAEPRRAVPLLKQALGSEDAGGLATLSAACFVPDDALTEPLARVATKRHPHLAFAAEVARVARGESNGAHIASVAPKIKESHRIGLCAEVFVPLLWGPALPSPSRRLWRCFETPSVTWVAGWCWAPSPPEPGIRNRWRKLETGPAWVRAARGQRGPWWPGR